MYASLRTDFLSEGTSLTLMIKHHFIYKSFSIKLILVSCVCRGILSRHLNFQVVELRWEYSCDCGGVPGRVHLLRRLLPSRVVS